jgi:hypothetical protein
MANYDKMVQAYVKMRDAKAALKKKHATELEELDNGMALIQSTLLAVMNEMDAGSLRVEGGTVVRQLNTRYWVSDWDEFRKFVAERDAFDLLERSVHQSNFKAFMEANPDVTPPVHADSKYTIKIMKR